MSARRPRFAACALARATASALSEARWEAADLLSRHPRPLVCELMYGRAAELTFSPLATDQMLAIALQRAAEDVRHHRAPLEEGAQFFHGCAVRAQAEPALEEPAARPAAVASTAAFRLAGDIERQLRETGLDEAALAARLTEAAGLHDALSADPRIPADAATRRRMCDVAQHLRERAAEVAPDWRTGPGAPQALGDGAPADEVDIETLRHPPILLGDADHEQLRSLAFSMLMSDPRAAAPLLAELERADVVPDEAVPPDVVRLGSWVEYAEAPEGRRGRARLVGSRLERTPQELSVLSPTGAALIGLSVGQSILWRDHVGVERLVTVREVRAA